jgi:hypothetical protein
MLAISENSFSDNRSTHYPPEQQKTLDRLSDAFVTRQLQPLFQEDIIDVSVPLPERVDRHPIREHVSQAHDGDA